MTDLTYGIDSPISDGTRIRQGYKVRAVQVTNGLPTTGTRSWAHGITDLGTVVHAYLMMWNPGASIWRTFPDQIVYVTVGTTSVTGNVGTTNMSAYTTGTFYITYIPTGSV